ncbi:MAG: prepilin-type N-terminal cleavage/methylation domain-containing protein [Gammaproteobacteria bacterium]|nr:prepilin-type N-terminal cleavage/methylation domain-containing protein [Gammaproteobacteria bacterium]
MQLTKQKGFTLVEIAIVLVIVGLLIGGVLKGQEMITNAKLKRIESDNAGVAAAMFSYQDRYTQLPGDDSAAIGRFDIFAGGSANLEGNGDGTIEGLWVGNDAAAAPDYETALFWKHLRASGLIAGAATDPTQPSNAYGGLMGIRDGALGITGHVTVFGQIEGPIAKILEGRLDDGVPNGGRVQSACISGAGPCEASGSSTDVDVAGTGDAAYTDVARYDMAFRL